MSHGNRNYRQCKRLFAQQGGLCHYCKEPMTLERPTRHKKVADNMATIEHLEDRYDPNRGKFAGQKRHVVACHKCNNGRNSVRQADPTVVSRAELRRRSRSSSRWVTLRWYRWLWKSFYQWVVDICSHSRYFPKYGKAQIPSRRPVVCS